MNRAQLEHIIRAAGSISKVVAGREKDLEFLQEAAATGLGDRQTLIDRLAVTVLDVAVRSAAHSRIDAAFLKRRVEVSAIMGGVGSEIRRTWRCP